jgi:hypothetical protein
MLAGGHLAGGTMTELASRRRVALAAFNQGAAMGPALFAIENAGFDASQLVIAAREASFAVLECQYRCGCFATRIAAHLVSGSSSLGSNVRPEPIRISGGTFWPSLSCFNTDPDGPLVIATWMPARLRDEIEELIFKGAVLLGIGAQSPEQQRNATQILLVHSSHRVHTVDFRH